MKRSTTARRPKPATAPARPSPPAQAVFDAIPYPTLGYTRDLRVEWANAAARSYFALSDEALVELNRRDTPRRREFRERHFRAWANGGAPYPVRFRWEGATGKGEFLLVPFPTPPTSRARFAFVLIPRVLLDAALGGASAAAASPARRWMVTGERFEKLTPREWEIARRIAVGDRVLLLAEGLRISPNTVRNHLKSIFRKVGVHSQLQLVRSVRALEL